MAERRMVSLTMVDDDRFLDMSAEAQLLYFHISMRADDDGFFSSRKLLRTVNLKRSNLDELVRNGYLLMFDSGVGCVIHWFVNNSIQKDRYKPSDYQERDLVELVTIGSRKEYRLKSEMPADTDRQQDGNRSETDRIQIVSKMETDRIQNGNTGKDRLGKDSTGKGRKEETRISNDILVEKKDPENEQPVFIEIPVIGGKHVPIPESFADQMQELYPAIDVREEIRRAKAWLLANPRNAKKDWKRFINSWLSRAQDKARAPARPQGRVSKDYDPNASHSGEGYLSVEF